MHKLKLIFFMFWAMLGIAACSSVGQQVDQAQPAAANDTVLESSKPAFLVSYANW